jgi:hypothetical protein
MAENKTPRLSLLERFLGQGKGKQVEQQLLEAADALDNAGIERKELSTAEKGLMDKMREGMMKTLGKYTDKADEAMADDVMRFVIERMMTDGLENEAVTEEVPVIEEEDEYDTQMRELREKEVSLLETLVSDQAELVSQQKAIGAELSTLQALPLVIAEIGTRLIALEKQLDARPRSASKAVETQLESPTLETQLKAQLEVRDNFWKP